MGNNPMPTRGKSQVAGPKLDLLSVGIETLTKLFPGYHPQMFDFF